MENCGVLIIGGIAGCAAVKNVPGKGVDFIAAKTAAREES